MARIVFQSRVSDDLLRIAEHLEHYEADNIPSRIEAITQAFGVLESNPFIGRPASNGRRELVIGEGTHCYVAKYRYNEARDAILVIAIRAQREAGYRD